jgi:hypothetical protein
MEKNVNRRGFIKGGLMASAGIAMEAAMRGAEAPASDGARPDLAADSPALRKAAMPLGKIGDVAFSRLMLGGNLISGYAHSRDLAYVAALMKRYNTKAKIRETLELAEAHGIDAINTAVTDDNSCLQEHWKQGGKMKWIAQAMPGENDNLDAFKRAIDLGAQAVHIHGRGSERLLEEENVELIGKIVQFIKSRKTIAGVAAHALKAIEACEKAGVDPDFYQKTLHTRDYPSAPKTGENGELGNWDNSWCRDAEAVSEFMWGVKKPWIAFKVMAAGAIPPRRAFQYAFDNGADFVLAGMFDFQIAEDARIAGDVLANVKRDRPWRS